MIPANIQFDPRMFDDLPLMVWIVTSDGTPAYFNVAALDFSGCESAEALAHQWFNRIHAEDHESYLAAVRGGLERQEPFAVSYRRKDRQDVYHPLVENCTPLHSPDGVFQGLVGFAGRPAHPHADSEPGNVAARLDLLSHVTHDIISDWELPTNQVHLNAAFLETLGEPPTEIQPAREWWKSRTHPDDVTRLDRLYEEAMQTGKASLSYEYRILDRQNQYRVLDSRAYLMRDADGQLLRVLVACRDITLRRHAEEAQARFMRMLEATPDYVGMGTPDGHPFTSMPPGRKMIGIGPDDVLDFHVTESHPDWANAIIQEEAIPTAIREGSWRGENAMLHRDGHEIPVSQVILAHRDQDGALEYLSTIIRDLSDRKRVEIERIEWANRYDAAIRASGQVLFDWNSLTNEFNYAGDTQRILGYTIPELAGGLDRFRQLIHPADLLLFDQRIQQVVITRDPFQLEFRVQHKSGEILSVETKGYFFLDRRGQIERMVGFLADVTAQRRAQTILAQAHDSLEQRVTERTAALARASALLEDRAHRQEAVAHLGQRALAGTNLNALMEEALQTIKSTLPVDACSLLAMTRDGEDLIMRAQAGWPEPVDNAVRVPLGSRSLSGYALMIGEAVISTDFATERRFTQSAGVVAASFKSGLSVIIKGDEGPLGVLSAFSLEPRKFIQDDVHFVQSVGNVLTAAIQRERAELSIRQAREEAEMASRAKSEFLSRMSHELRTPLNAILGFGQLLEIDSPTPSQAESIEHISRAGKHLLALINEVLDVSRLEAGRLELATEPIEVHSFLLDALELIRPLAQRNDVHLLLDSLIPPPEYHVLGDRHRLWQVMSNLLSNAVKYNRAGGRVVVSYRADGPHIRITIVDTGRGIEADKLARLFLPFERLGAESTEIEGAGIGLALSRGIVTALHGELSVESRVGEGSTFSLTLPRADEDAGAGEARAATAPEDLPQPEPGRPHTILYIEDQDLNLRLVERILGPRPEYRLLTAMLGGEGLDLAHAEKPDLILLDLNLPDMTGDAVLHRLKNDHSTRHIPVIMVSADALGERNDHLLRLGASGYLTKPYKLDQFLSVIQSTLTKKV